MRQVSFFVPGEPRGKARPRVVSGHAYTPRETADYERMIRLAYTGEIIPQGVPVRISIVAVYSIPKRASKRQHDAMLAAEIRPTKKPDADNICKAVMDALNGIAYHDDAQICNMQVIKYYGTTPGLEITIGPL